jgi:Cu/Ag efflux protein CusF
VRNITVLFAATVFISAGVVNFASAQQGSVLDPMAHPASAEFESPFSTVIIPLDARLSWKNRFNGDQSFNEQERLGQTTGMASSMSGDMTAMDHSGHGESGMAMDATGVVQQIKPGEGKVKIKHGPVDRLGMPAMTMVFKVEDVAMLENIEKGQSVGFIVDNSSGGFLITHLMKMPTDGAESASTDSISAEKAGIKGNMDAQGIIKKIQRAQGKVKIEHGPIDRLGMPGMTMVFKVQDPTQLDGLEKGSTVDFSVDNSSGGFVITDIKSAQ